MKKIFLLLFLFFVSSFVQSQTKYLIYFKDKGISPQQTLQKSSSLFKMAEKELSEKAIERRKQVMGEDNYITYEDLPLNENYVQQIENLGIKIENKLKWFNAVSAYLTDSQLEKLKKISSVEKIERVHIFKSQPEIKDYNGQKFNTIPKINSTTTLNYGPSFTQAELSDIPAVHDLGIKGTGVYVGILDNGFSWQSHISLQNLKVMKEYDYVEKDNVAQNQSGHGQAVFSIMAGNDPGKIIGPAYDAQFYLAKTENDASETHAEEDNYAAALQDMEGAGIQITSSSLGYATEFTNGDANYTFADMNGQTTIVVKSLNLSFDRGVSTFTAAGNERGKSWNHIVSPADAFNVITVGSVTSSNLISSFSSPGPTSDGRIKPEIVAMGSSVYHADPNFGYSFGNGTSYATPIAAGIAALLKSCWPHLTNVQIRKIFLESGDNTASPNNDRGWGLISAKKVISYPNLSAINNVYNVLNKIFINSDGVNSSTVRLNYKVGGGSYQTVSMSTEVFNSTIKYNYSLPTTSNGTTVEFYFTYQTNTGGSVLEPASGTYKFSYGSMNISNLTSVKNNNDIPTQFYLSQNYPNPFNPSTVISYRLSVTSKVSLKVYDLLGREVQTLVNEVQLPGVYNSQFSIRNSPLPSGVYFYRLQAGDPSQGSGQSFIQTKKMILIK